MSKAVYISHKIYDDSPVVIHKNIVQLHRVISLIIENFSNTYLVICPYVGPLPIEENKTQCITEAQVVNEATFESGIIDEVWVCSKQSPEMLTEIDWCSKFDIPWVVKPNIASKCCCEWTTVRGRVTKYYQCNKCKEPCDIIKLATE